MRRTLCAGLGLVLLAPGTVRAQAASVDPELDKGVALVEEGDFESATATLGAAVQRLSAKGGHPRELSRAYLYLAIASLQLSQEQAAKARFIEALKLDEGLKLSPYEFPPKIIQAFEQARREATGLRGAPKAPRDPALVPVFFEAVKAGDFVGVRQLLKDDPALANEKDAAFGATPLHWGALRGNEAIVALLLAEGANTEAHNRDGETPYQVARRGRNPAVSRLLEPPSASGGIFDAVKRGDVATVRKLLSEDPALLNQRDSGFRASPLHWAALRGHVGVAQLLLAQGADTSAINADGETPLQVAERAKKPEVAALLRQPASAATAAARAGSGELFDAVKRGDLARVKQLVEGDPALVEERDPAFGATALHWAALKGYRGVAAYLVAQGADVRARNRDGETPLQVARRAGKSDVAKLLER